jgi:hypothetical protein
MSESGAATAKQKDRKREASDKAVLEGDLAPAHRIANSGVVKMLLGRS